MKSTKEKPKTKPRREPLFSRSRLFVIVGGVIAASVIFFRFVWVLPEHDLQLPAAVITLALLTFAVGQFIRHRLHRSRIAWTIVGLMVIVGYVAFEWEFGSSRRETEVVDWINGQGGKAEYRRTKFDSPDDYFGVDGWCLPVWVTEITGQGYFTELDIIDLQGRQFGDDVIPQLSHVQRLDDLFLAHSAITADGVAQLPVIPGVRQILLDWRQVSPAAILKLSQFEDLEFLSIVYPGEKSVAQRFEPAELRVTDLTGLDQIKELTISCDTPLTAADAAAIASLGSLTKLYVNSPYRDTPREIQPSGALLPLANSPKLQGIALTLHCQDISLEEVEAFASMPKITQISIYRNNRTPFPVTKGQLRSIMTKFPRTQIYVSPLQRPGGF